MSKIEIGVMLKFLEKQSIDLEYQANIKKTSNDLQNANMLKGKSAGILQATHNLKPRIEYMQSEIKVKRIAILILTGLLIIAGVVIYNQAKLINILQNYNDEVLNEEVDYNSFQD